MSTIELVDPDLRELKRPCEFESTLTAMRAAIAGGIVNTAQVANSWMRLVTAARPAMSARDSIL